MNIQSKLAWKSMWKNKARTAVTIIGIVLAAAMFTAVLGAAMSLWNYLVRGAQFLEGDYYIAYHYPDQQQILDLEAMDEVTSVADYQAAGFVYFSEYESPGSTFVLAAADQTFFDTMPVRLKEGRLPQSSGEIVLPETAVTNMKYEKIPCTVGETVTLNVKTNFSSYGYQMIPPETEERYFSMTYTIVGIAEDSFYGCEDAVGLMSMLTLADGAQPDAIWHRLYVKTDPAAVVMDWTSDQFGRNATRNIELLGLYGVSEYSNYNLLTVGIVAALLSVVFICSVSLIYNSFSISVSERMKEFGLLTSVGMTGRQLRKLVLTEALLLCALTIPVGLLMGNGAVVLAVQALGKWIHVQYSYSLSGDVLLEPVLPLSLSVAAGVITVLTVLASVAIPAVKASRYSPISVIRQHTEYQTGKMKRVRGGRLSRIFGVPAMLAGKYFCVQRRRYLAIILSLALSVTVFIGASSVSAMMQTTAEAIVRTQDFDFYISGTKEELEEIRRLPCVEKSALSIAEEYALVVNDEQLDDTFVKFWRSNKSNYSSAYPNYIRNVVFLYLEDAVLLEYLQSNGLDFAPYFDSEDTAVLLCQSIFETANSNAGGSVEKKTYPCFPFTQQLGHLELLPGVYHTPPEVYDYMDGNISDITTDLDGEGTPYLQIGRQRFMMDVSYDENNVVSIDYYACDMTQFLGNNLYAVTDTYVGSLSAQMPNVHLGDMVVERPYGVGAAGTCFYSDEISGIYDEIVFILPLSALDSSDSIRYGLSVTTSDYSALKSYLLDTELSYEDYKGGEEQQRSLVQIVDVLSYVFLILVVLICVCNIFNTISTNIALRRRDFGMLRSIGMKGSQLRNMLLYECVSYGLRALLFGIPLGCGANLLVHRLSQSVVVSTYEPPVNPILIASGSVFAVVLLSMIYAVGKLRKDSPIEAIRMENT